MNPFKFLLFTFGFYLSLVLIFGGGKDPTPEPIPTQTRITVQIVPLTDEQMADRDAEIAQQMAEENASIYDEPAEPSTTLPQLAQIDSDTKCQQWLPLAVEMGWPNETEVLETLGFLMWREARCDPNACSPSDSGRPCADYGILQGNWYAHHEWWAQMGLTPEDMFDPAINLHWAGLLYNGREAKNQCGWQPWRLSC